MEQQLTDLIQDNWSLRSGLLDLTTRMAEEMDASSGVTTPSCLQTSTPPGMCTTSEVQDILKQIENRMNEKFNKLTLKQRPNGKGNGNSNSKNSGNNKRDNRGCTYSIYCANCGVLLNNDYGHVTKDCPKASKFPNHDPNITWCNRTNYPHASNKCVDRWGKPWEDYVSKAFIELPNPHEGVGGRTQMDLIMAAIKI